MDEAIELARALERGGADFLIPVAGTFEAFALPENAGMFSRPAFQLAAAARVAQAVSIPVLANGNLGTPAEAARHVGEGPFAGIALARPLLTDPDWPLKAAGRLDVAVRTCSCAPPTCLRTQMSGTTCAAWPSAAIQQGFLGYGF